MSKIEETRFLSLIGWMVNIRSEWLLPCSQCQIYWRIVYNCFFYFLFLKKICMSIISAKSRWNYLLFLIFKLLLYFPWFIHVTFVERNVLVNLSFWNLSSLLHNLTYISAFHSFLFLSAFSVLLESLNNYFFKGLA